MSFKERSDLIGSLLDAFDTDKFLKLLENVVLGGSARNTRCLLLLLGGLAGATLDLTACCWF